MATDALAALQAEENQRAAAEAETKRRRDAEVAKCDALWMDFSKSWRALAAPDGAFDRTTAFPWAEYGRAFRKFRSFLDAEGLTDRIAANVDDLLSVRDAPQMGISNSGAAMLRLLQSVLRGARDAISIRSNLAKANDLSWASSIGNHGWAGLLWEPGIEGRQAWWKSAENAKPAADERENADGIERSAPASIPANPNEIPVGLLSELTDGPALGGGGNITVSVAP